MTEGSSSGRGQWSLYVIVVAVYMFWGGNFVFSKIALREMPGALVAGMRTIIASALLMAFYRGRRSEGRPALRREEYPRLFLIGVCGIAINQMCFLVGLSLTSASHASLVIGLTPFMVLFLALFRRHEAFTFNRAFGLGVAVCGMLLLQKPSTSAQSASLLGDLLILGAGLSFAVYTVFGKELAAEHGGIAVIAVSYAAGGLILLPMTLYFASRFDFSHVSAGAWWAFAYMTVVSSVLCYIGWAYALKRLSASRLSAFSYLQPLVATLLALPMLGEPITATLVSGGGLIMAGVFLSERS
ncbi:MAG: DMT family transporter [Acidobacteria bacterium]|nr:DMT family transporter [Acidobacteriota bacterium]